MTKCRAILAAFTLFAFPLLAGASEFSDNAAANLNSTAFDALAKDLGALVGGGTFHSGESLGFPVGFDIGYHVDGTDLDNKDVILRDNHSFATANWVQAELGLPAKLGVIGRYGKIYSADVYGGGLHYGLLKSDVPGVPSISISALYHQLNDDTLKGRFLSGNLVASFDVPILHPYLGAGYDNSHIETKGSGSIKGDANGYRVEAGLNLSLIPFTYITLGGGVANGQKMGHAGAGIRF